MDAGSEAKERNESSDIHNDVNSGEEEEEAEGQDHTLEYYLKAIEGHLPPPDALVVVRSNYSCPPLGWCHKLHSQIDLRN